MYDVSNMLFKFIFYICLIYIFKLTIDIQKELLNKIDDVDENYRKLHNIHSLRLVFLILYFTHNVSICQWAPLFRPHSCRTLNSDMDHYIKSL